MGAACIKVTKYFLFLFNLLFFVSSLPEPPSRPPGHPAEPCRGLGHGTVGVKAGLRTVPRGIRGVEGRGQPAPVKRWSLSRAPCRGWPGKT